MKKHKKKLELRTTAIMSERTSARIRFGAMAVATGAVLTMGLAVPTFALEIKTMTPEELRAIMDKEHPNKPEGSWEIEPLKSLPPSYEGHVHVPMPFANGKLALNLDRIDRTNSEIEFSIDKNWLGNRRIKRIGFAAVRWYGFAIDNSGLYEANTFDNEWTTKLFTSKVDYEEITDRHESNGRYFWIKPTFDLFYEWSNDIVFVLQLDDNTYYNGRVIFKSDCMANWYEGKACRAKSYDETKTMWNVGYEAEEAPKKKYEVGMSVSEANGYMNGDMQSETPGAPVEPEKPETPVEPEKPEIPAEPEKPVVPTEPEKPVVPIKPEEPIKPEVPVEPEKPKNTEEPEKKEMESSNETTVEIGKTEKETENENTPEGKNEEKNEKTLKVHMAGRRPYEMRLSTQNTSNQQNENNENTEVDEAETTEIEADETEENNNDGASETEEKNEQLPAEVPKLGEVKKEFSIFNQWWAWLIAGTIVGAILHKIFLSIHSKKQESISD